MACNCPGPGQWHSKTGCLKLPRLGTSSPGAPQPRVQPAPSPEERITDLAREAVCCSEVSSSPLPSPAQSPLKQFKTTEIVPLVLFQRKELFFNPLAFASVRALRVHPDTGPRPPTCQIKSNVPFQNSKSKERCNLDMNHKRPLSSQSGCAHLLHQRRTDGAPQTQS